MLKEKTMNTDKKIILLRSLFAMVMVFFLALGFVTPLTAYAAVPEKPIDYTELDYTVTEGPLYNRVTVPLSSDYIRYELRNDTTGTVAYHRGTTTYTFYANPNNSYTILIHPLSSYGLSLANIPDGAKILVDFKVTCHSDNNMIVPNFYQRHYYTGERNQWLTSVYEDEIPYGFGEDGISLVYDIEKTPLGVDDEPIEVVNFVPALKITPFRNVGNADYTFTLYVENVYLVMDISTGHWEQWLANQLGEKLDNVNDSLGDVNDKLGDVNDKLDDTNEKLDELPGEIGDEMQGVIDKENEKAESSGNKFVNQILDKLPDPSTEVLGSLKGLTDSMAYTGTDCKLKIPALVIPAVDGLFPETEIWGGTEFSFSDYLSFLPPTLLTVVQSLFTIAIVLYCVYELKDIIAFIFTLNELHNMH